MKFETGKTYTTRFATNASMTIAFTVIKRTAKFITVEDKYGTVARVGVKIDDEGEYALPTGSYSMAPVIKANRPAGA